MANHIIYPVCAFFPIYVSFCVKCLLKYTLFFFLSEVSVFLLSCETSLYFLDTNPLMGICVINIFCQFVTCLFTFVAMSFVG